MSQLPEPLIHYAVAYALIAYSTRRYKEAAIASIAALLPDIDALFHIHRSATHSYAILIPIIILVIIAVSYRIPKYKNLAISSSIALLTHPILDAFQSPTPILWPLIDKSIYFNISCWVLIEGSSIIPKITSNISLEYVNTEFTSFKYLDAPLYTSEGVIIAILIFIPTIASIVRNLIKEGG